MQWSLISPDSFPSRIDYLTLESYGMAVRLADRWLAYPDDASMGAGAFRPAGEIPVLLLEQDELEQKGTWTFLLRFLRKNLPALARLNQELDFPSDGLLEALGWKAHYRSREEWKQWAELDQLSEELYLSHDFPLNVLRLWNRLESEERLAWAELWNSRNFKKNLIREIILYFHDLAAVGRKECLAEALRFSENWKARSGNFPAETIRDMVYGYRYPEIHSMQEQVFRLQKSLPSDRRFKVLIPEHLEAGSLDIQLKIGSSRDLDDLLSLLQDSSARQRILEILNLVQ
ncbi:MAG: hypothetical protein KDK25_04375 [Leptospiraceae bacterium]|nr:hypothetical protein [Leptospiraceae bacterium]